MQHLFKANNTNKRLQPYKRSFLHALLAFVLLVPMMGWGQSAQDFSGEYRIANRMGINNPYNSTNTTNNYYLCPATDLYNTDMPFLTTHTPDANDHFKWRVIFAETVNGRDYYYIYHINSEKYLTYNEQLVNGNDSRVRVHLQSTIDEDGKSLFFFTHAGGSYSSESSYNIVPKSDGSARSLNPAKNNYNQYDGNSSNSPGVYTNLLGNTGYCGGLIGVYTQNDQRGLWFLEDLYPRPTITYSAATNEITLACSSGFDAINYTLFDADGNTLSSSSTTSSPFSFVLQDANVKTIKATATYGPNVSPLVTYTIIVQTTVGTDLRPYLVRSNANPWTFADRTKGVFYMIPGDVNNNGNTTANTSSMPRPTMEWYFKDAGFENGIQYYYIVNAVQSANNTDLYLYRTDDNIYVKELVNNDNGFKFFLIERTAGFNIVPYGITSKFLNKNNGNTSPNPLNLNNSTTSDNTNWNFVLPSELDATPPFIVSNANVSYYKIENYSSGNSGNFIISPTDPSLYVTTSNNPEADAMKWYFEEAQGSTSNDWLTYYHIRNATTGYYMYYNGNPPSTNSNSFNVSSSIEDSPDSYQFAIVKSPQTDVYYIVPKPLKDNSLSTVYTIYRNNAILRVGNNRNVNTITWTFPAPVVPFKCETPVIAYNSQTGTINITSPTLGATIYYQHYDSEPSSEDIPALIPENVFSGEFVASPGYYKAVVARSADGTDRSEAVTSEEIGEFHCIRPIIRVSSAFEVTITCATPGADIYYIVGDGDFDENEPNFGGTHFEGPFTISSGNIVKAIAIKGNDWNNRSPIAIYDNTVTLITSSDQITNMNGNYKIGESFVSTATIGSNADPFTGILDGSYVEFELEHPLFAYVEGAVIKNLQISHASISTSNNAGAIANVARGESRIYNCGVLDGSISGSGSVGSIVGLLEETSRVINCYSYATITNGSNVGGIVGYNNVTTTASDINTMVMNCMFYGDITRGDTKSPVYGGNNIANLQGGLNTFNYYAYKKLPTNHITSGKYNSTLAVEDKYLTRFEFYRLLLNSNKKLAAFYASTNTNTVNPEDMAKWVLETADRTITNPKPYPILKPQGVYPSIINPDIEHAPDSTSVGPNKGGKLGRTLSVTISSTQTTGGQTKPTGASITTSNLTLQRTDKDFDRFNYNYDKVQLPYYNDVGTGNYTGNRVVTGWKITAIITDVDRDPYTSANYDYSKTYASNQSYFDYPNYNFADRKSSNKDLYSVSGRVFSQGAYFDVPYGVTSITIEPYWAKAAYIADPNYDVVYKGDYTDKQNVTQTGTQVGSDATFNGEASQVIKTTVSDALTQINNNLGGYGPTVYDNAVVLVGNLHLDGVPSSGTNPFTMMSVDMDNDHEPDYSLIYHHKNRQAIAPIRFDFLNIPGTAQVQKPNGANLVCNFTIFKTKGWFENTNTALFYTSQLEYENLDGVTKTDAPLILLGGVIDQFVSTQNKAVNGKTIYIHVGGNVWINSFGLGTHSDGSQSTPHVPVSVTGGEYEGFYLTGTYNANAAVSTDNAECYISGGYFHEAAGASQEQINGNVRWQIYNADIDNFYGGGTNDAKPITGDVTTDIFNSRVTTYCGGPKFGNMQSGKKVTTKAEGCTFGKFFGAGYGGLSYTRKKYTDATDYNFNTLQNYYTTDRGKYYDGEHTQSSQQGGTTDYGKKGPGVATDFDYEFFVWSTGPTGARFYVKFASFSLAQCNDVASTLKNCTINENFYGGGSLGKVVGTTTSVLDGCTVKGNVFGAGYSATLPKIPVRDGGFAPDGSSYLIPKFNGESGMFEPGVFSGTTDFTWKQVESYPSEGGAGFDGTQVITMQNLDKTNLGSVQEASLTLKGNTTVGTLEGGSLAPGTGNVYGGGDESTVDANTTVILQGNAHILGNVYGGGNNGSVGGDSEVRIVDE